MSRSRSSSSNAGSGGIFYELGKMTADRDDGNEMPDPGDGAATLD